MTVKNTKIDKKSKKSAVKTSKKNVRKKQVGLERPPVVAVLGHVDHGKTSLLDAIRGTSVQEGEAGGITQSVRAHQITTKNGQRITFIDTPGHEAFSAMRSRGAAVTDIVLLVVSAVDGVKPQTKESIKYAKKAGAHIIVAANKIDLPGANLEKLKKELSTNDVLIEEYGGDAIFVPVSAIKKQGLDDLLESILLLAEVHGVKDEKPEKGIAQTVVLESTTDKSLGPVALVLVKRGLFKAGNYTESESGVSKIRTILDEFQKTQDSADVSDPVWIVGLSRALVTGEVVNIFEQEDEAKDFNKSRIKETEKEGEGTETFDHEVQDEDLNIEQTDLEALANLLGQNREEGEKKKLDIVLKTDAIGTLEAATDEMKKLGEEGLEINILDSGTGEVTEKDVERAKLARGIVLAFRVDVSKDVQAFAKREKVLVRKYEIIYEMIDEVGAALHGLMEPEEEEVEVARALVKKVFVLTNGDLVAGSVVTKGKIIKGYKVFVERKGERVADGKVVSLKQNKSEVKEVDKGLDCGILIEPKAEVEEGDEIIAYKIEKY
ncbi:translation initiation factor IF-2 [Candidatus Dojkabacteria bacterium]|nr:translation initiation factor IF-2 [Candidatus Dojkabacteria bacterium]